MGRNLLDAVSRHRIEKGDETIRYETEDKSWERETVKGNT